MGFPGRPHTVGEGSVDRARRGFRHLSSSVRRVTRGGPANGPVVAIPRRFRRGPVGERAGGGASEPSPDCIDSPHAPSVSSRASPDDPRFDPRPASARRDLERRSSADSSSDPLVSPEPGATLCHRFHASSRSLVHLSSREGLSWPGAPPRPEMRPSGTPTGAANAKNGPSREVRIRPDEADIPAQPNQAPP